MPGAHPENQPGKRSSHSNDCDFADGLRSLNRSRLSEIWVFGKGPMATSPCAIGDRTGGSLLVVHWSMRLSRATRLLTHTTSVSGKKSGVTVTRCLSRGPHYARRTATP
jgi:hypothetical protein